MTFGPGDLLLLVSFISASLVTFADSLESKKSGGTVSFYVENDTFAGKDQYYTSGIKIGWSSPDLNKFSDSPYSAPFLPVLEAVPLINNEEFQRNLVLAIGQNIYTPDQTELEVPLPNDRPYAGWLYLGVGVVWKNAKIRNSVVFDIGVVGPWSYAEEAQRMVHDALGNSHPQGWASQLHNELGFTATYERTWRWPRQERRSGLSWELLPHAGGAAGNVATYANCGAELRAGFNLPDDFGASTITSSAVTSTPVDGSLSAQRSHLDFGVHVFARADGRAVAHNIFLDGNTFGTGPSVEHRPFVGDLSAGLAVNYHNTKVSYAFVYRSVEFYGQAAGQFFGTISVNLSF